VEVKLNGFYFKESRGYCFGILLLSQFGKFFLENENKQALGLRLTGRKFIHETL